MRGTILGRSVDKVSRKRICMQLRPFVAASRRHLVSEQASSPTPKPRVSPFPYHSFPLSVPPSLPNAGILTSTYTWSPHYLSGDRTTHGLADVDLTLTWT